MAAVAEAKEAVWNRLDVPWPSCSATVAVPPQHVSVRCLLSVLKGCHAVNNILKNKAMVAEQSLLHSIMYSFRYQMSRHRPYRSLRQVEQCLKRLNSMNLEKPIQDLIRLGPIKQKSENAEDALVPSQPVIEVILLKILGSCKLILRLLECCCTAFLILYRGVLKSLSSLYMSLFKLLQEVTKTQPRPYIKGFAFPSEIYEFLGTTYSEIKKKMPKAFVMKKAGTGWMDRLFVVNKTVSQASSAGVPTRKKRRKAQNTIDIGKPVVVNRTKQDLGKEFDIKRFCRYPNPAPQENTKFMVKLPKSKRRTTLVSSKSLRALHLKSFVSKFQEASTFGELSDTLRTTILWCKSNTLRSEAFFLGMKLLKSRRLQHVETQGCSLRRKLGCVKATVCKYLVLASCRHRPTQRPKAHSHLQKQIKLSRKSRCVSKRTPSRIIPQQRYTSFKDSRSFTLAQWSSHFSPVWNTYSGSNKVSVEKQARGYAADLAGLERKPSHKQEEATKNKDDIDDIFKIIGL